jgi:nitronate monooxygenase
MKTQTAFMKHAGVEVPLICGAMYPCSNPELVATVSEAGGLGVIQPISLTYVHGHKFREGLKKIRSLTSKPVGFNALVEKSSKIYEDRMKEWIDIALDEDIKFFITALGNPRWVVEKVHAAGGIVYHDVTERKWAEKALEAGVDGLICVNSTAGGHAGTQSPQELFEDLSSLGVPLVCAGGVGTAKQFADALKMGYAGVQMGTRFIASTECLTHDSYKDAIVKAKAKDIVLTQKISGVPVAVIETPYIKAVGTKAGPIVRRLLKGRKTKHWMRMYYTIKSAIKLKKASLKGAGYQEYWQAGKSVEGIDRVESAEAIVKEFAKAID